jgi:hypothetical protein
MTKLAEIRKALVAALGLVAQAASAGLLHGRALAVAEAVLGLATAAGVYVVPNGATNPSGYVPGHVKP